MITCTQEVRDLFMASHRQVMRITLEGGAIRDSERVYAVLSDSSTVPLGALALADGTTAGADADWALFRNYITDISQGIEITEADILVGGFTLDRYSMCTDRIEIGSAVASELTLTLQNLIGTFDAVRFEGAEMHVELGVKDWDTDSEVQWISLGYFTADKQPKNTSTVKVTALDRMVLFDKDIDWDQYTFPCTLQYLIQRTCTLCGVTLATNLTTLPNYDYEITYCPETTLPYRTLIQWGAFLTGTCALMNENGQLAFRWYTDCGVTIGAGQRYSHDIEEDDITISGVYYKAESGLEYLAGTADYCLEMNGCQILQNNVEDALANIYTSRGGFTYRPFTAVIQSAPFLEPLDMITFTDKNGVNHPCIISKITFTGNASTPVSGVGETATQASYAGLTGLTREQTQAVDDAKKYATNYLSSDAGGIMVANMTDGKRYTPSEVPDDVKNTYIDNESFQVRDGQKVLARFGEDSQIGADESNHLGIDTTGIQGVNEEGVNVFSVDMDGGSLPYSGKKTFWYNSTYYERDVNESNPSVNHAYIEDREHDFALLNCTRFTDKYELVLTYSDSTTETDWISGDFVNDKTIDYEHRVYVDITKPYASIRLKFWWQQGELRHSYEIQYIKDTSLSRYVTNVHIKGPITEYSGYMFVPAYSLGIRRDYNIGEIGAFTGICGEFLSAKTRDQFACGRFNRDESDYAFMVGNGSTDEESNAFAVTWDGNHLMALDTEATTGTDADLYNAITALGWEDEVIL